MYNLVQLRASERDSRVNWFSSGLQSTFRESIGSVRDFRAQSANHLIKFGTSERRAQIIWFSSGLQSANHLVQFGTLERRAQIIWFSSGLQSACVCMYIYIYILYMRYQKGQICLLKHVSKYI